MSDKIRKYVLPNLPYLFVFWFFSKIGTAYRIAPGTDFGTKLMGMLDTFPRAFETYWPGLGGIDLLVGLAGAAGVYLLIQSKIRQAKKFRRDAEYGTARFGTKEDIKPFVDPKFQNNVILTGTEFLTMNTRPKIPANARNLNACVIGSSGSGKTRFWLTPQLLQAHSSYVVVDPKGGTLDQCGRFLQREKYRVRVFNSIDFSKSMHYNPLAYIKTESDVLKFVTALIANTKGDGKEGDEFWTKAETLLYCALVAYIVFEGPEEERNMNTLVEMINSMEVREDDETFKNAVDYMFDGLERRSPQHFAVRQYKKYKLASGKTAKWPTLSQRSSGNSSILLFCKPMRQSWNRWRSAALWGVRPSATNSKPEKRLPNRQRQSGLRRKSPAAVQSVDLGPCWHEAERRREPCHANGRAMTRPAITTENCWAAVPKRTATPIPC